MRGLIVIAALLGCYPVLLVAALWPAPVVFGLVAAASYAVECVAPRAGRPLPDLLAKVHLGITLRFAARETMALLLVARTTGADSPWFVALAAGVLAIHGVRALHTGLALRLRQMLSRMPVTTRNLDVSALRIPRMPPRPLRDGRSVPFLYLDAFPVLGAVLGAVPATLGAGLALVAGLTAALALIPYVRRATPSPTAPVSWRSWASRSRGIAPRSSCTSPAPPPRPTRPGCGCPRSNACPGGPSSSCASAAWPRTWRAPGCRWSASRRRPT
ncbi:hypothetical protein ACFQYP_44190 [Nonomuraea antimicrobica]